MATRRLGIIMHGVTGRMGYNQHLVRSIVAIRAAGGVPLPNGDRAMPDPILVGRNAEKVAELAKRHGIERHTGDLDAALANPDDTIFFDAGSTQMRVGLLTRAMEAGKHVYCEKPISETLDEALQLARLAQSRGLKNGVVQDKLFLPGLRKLQMLKDLRVLRPHPLCARRVRLLGVRGRLAGGAASFVELSQGGRRRHSSSICCRTGATCSTTCSAP